ncbi:MAG TPA: RagB/SusD family nutrient uptake outer membrane protein [Chitinophaga sp.]|uniref:RagB/SusD family nutrient uptake outer membrane protein n=1 Tax=Chitinophaga sp. TaxID=1869181 RepID=UPI002B8F8F3D|nr:RagB/SusD family nutrient uptake outer membrane protein [Chitinophaga sp.]HVI47698.1 RagB/SusD family nutrient uptake outer membrane protein [Chitinophaga sp.]
MKLRKYILHASLAACTLALASGCNKKLDVLPSQEVTPGQITTSEDVKAVLAGCYASLQHANAFGERYLVVADLLGRDNAINFVGTFAAYRAISVKQQDRNSSIAEDMWARAYITIAGANTVLDKIGVVNKDEQKVVTAEARFIRGITYFELVNFYAQPWSAGNTTANDAVPIVLEPISSYDPTRDKRPRAKVSEVYKLVIDDLTAALNDLPESNENARATKYAAEAFLARVYMNQGRYAEAAAAANDVIAKGGFVLVTSVDKAFNNNTNSTEDIFAIQQNKQSNAGTTDNGVATFYSAKPVGRGDLQIMADWLNNYEDGDDRKAFVYEGTSISGIDGTYTGKWKQQYKVVPVVRLSEMVLTRAEANFRSGGAPVGGVTPLADVNAVRARAHAGDLSVVTADDIISERFRELAFEGDRLWTIKRLKLKLGSRDYNDPILVLPVPQTERDVNPNMTQNTGY